MAKNFASLVFTDSVKELQERAGSRQSYARMERDSYVGGLIENETQFIEDRDSFYLASVGENNFPYIQHRGGPKGFIKVLDKNRIGILDFRGNMQYISIGNISTNNIVALIMVDYPNRARLKIAAKAEVIELIDNPNLYKLLDLRSYAFKPERMIVFTIEAYDWNCPQHITPRFTIDEIEVAFKRQRKNISRLEAEVKDLQNKLKAH
jgi:uncharacterized protein